MRDPAPLSPARSPFHLEFTLMMTEVQPETQATEEHLGLWSLVITAGESYGLSQSQSCHVFKTEDAAYQWAAELLVRCDEACRDDHGFCLHADRCDSARELVERYQDSIFGLDWFHVFPAFNGE